MLEASLIISSHHDTDDVDTVTLDFNQRFRRRCLMKSDNGLEFLLNLLKPTVLKQGDILKLSDGRLIKVKAAEEEVLDIQSGDSLCLLSVAWSLGNMHRPLEILPFCLRIRYDSLLEKELSKQNVILTRHFAPFTPHTNAKGHRHE